MAKYEVWFQYNKAGTYNFNSLARAKSFAKKFRKNKPIVYSKVVDRPLKLK
jgi:hypothetical protein